MDTMKHQTWTDWDWSDANWEFWAGIYISPPTSLHFTAATLTANLCHLVDALCLPQGKMVSWCGQDAGNHHIFHFRNQQATPNASFINCYYLDFKYPKPILYRRVNNVNTQLAIALTTITIPAWYTVDLTWWRYQAPYEPLKLRIRAHWSRPTDSLYETIQYDDNQNLWDLSPVNRCGLAGDNAVTDTIFDDTEIWKPE